MKKYCAIEYLRVWFLILIIMTHSVMGDMLVWGRILHTMGSRVDIFMLICGFFLFVSLKKTDMTLWKRIKHRCIRILPVLILYKTLAMLFKVGHGGNFLSNIFMLNQNIGIHIPTMTHIIWYVDVMFWVYLFYVTLFDIVQRKTALFITTIIMIMSLVVLFGNDNINLHFEMAAPFLDGGVLRGLAFIGMGILIAAIPKINIGSKIFNKLMITGVECLSAYNVMFYTTLYHHITPVGAFNHVLWGGVFIYLMVSQAGYLSQWLNRQTAICHVSKYAYEIYVFQFFAITLSCRLLSPEKYPILTSALMLALAYAMGVVAHNVYQKNIEKLLKQ